MLLWMWHEHWLARRIVKEQVIWVHRSLRIIGDKYSMEGGVKWCGWGKLLLESSGGKVLDNLIWSFANHDLNHLRDLIWNLFHKSDNQRPIATSLAEKTKLNLSLDKLVRPAIVKPQLQQLWFYWIWGTLHYLWMRIEEHVRLCGIINVL